MLKDEEQSLGNPAGARKQKKSRIINELTTKSPDSGGSLAQAEAVSCVKIVVRLSELFVVIDRQVLNPVASPRQIAI